MPDKIRYFELVTMAGREPGQSHATDAGVSRREVSFSAFGRNFTMQLEPNDLFAPDSRNTWIGSSGRDVEAPAAVFYKGELAGEAGSWARVTLTGGSIDGMISTADDVYFVEPASRYFTGAPATELVVYRLSDCDPDWETGTCALDDPEIAAEMGADPSPSVLSNYEAINAFLPEAPTRLLRRCEIGLVADHELYQRHGTATATYIQGLVNQMDGIFRRDHGVAITIAQTAVYTTADDPFSSTTDAASLVREIVAWKSSARCPISGVDVTHLFTGRDLNGYTVGISYLATVCNSEYGVSLSQSFTDDNKSLVLVVSHEIGHNFGAYHDNQSGSPCAPEPFGFVMNPYVSSQLSLSFSSCTKGLIANLVAGAGCLDSVDFPNRPPVALAGADQSTVTSARVSIDGSGSYDPDGDTISYAWKQIKGAKVKLANMKSSTLAFTAPRTAARLVFRLTVSDGSLTRFDDVIVAVKLASR
ncbi:MAG: M12 family metallo-peptidase [Acidobacteriota bacterium]